jgi:soluble P-type ATPase
MPAAEQNVTLRRAVKYLVDHDADGGGNLSRLAEHLGVSRQRVHQIAQPYRKARLAEVARQAKLVPLGGIGKPAPRTNPIGRVVGGIKVTA